MTTFLLRRVAGTLPLLLVASFVVFALTSFAGDPLARLAGTDVDPAVYDEVVARYALDEPIPVRYVRWLTAALQGDFGASTAFQGSSVGQLVGPGLLNTARLVVPAFLLGAVLAVVLGVVTAMRPGSWLDEVISSVSFALIAIPTFISALTLQIAFGVWLPEWSGWQPFPVFGMRTIVDDGWAAMVASHVLPIASLTLVLAASQSRYQRTAMIEVLGADHLRTARAKGVPESRVILRHGLRNAMIPVVTVWAIEIAVLFGGAVVTETIFAWPGLGRLLVTGVTQQDLNLTMAVVMIVAFAVVVTNLVADLVYGVLDPRIRHA